MKRRPIIMFAIIALVIIAIVALSVLSVAVHVLFSPLLVLVAVAILAWLTLSRRRSRR
jgi:FtsH-binding integral membrane protein